MICCCNEYLVGGNSCCEHEDRTLSRLQNTNHELKNLIEKLEDLSEDVDKSICKKKHMNNCYRPRAVESCHIVQYAPREVSPEPRYFLKPTICDDCDHFNYLKQLETLRKDPNIYPEEKYPGGRGIHHDECKICELKSRMQRNNRSRSRCRSRESSPNQSSIRYTMNVIKPKWNGGPYVSSYNWRNDKLSESYDLSKL